jgi:predicted outer membrane repeat protein
MQFIDTTYSSIGIRKLGLSQPGASAWRGGRDQKSCSTTPDGSGAQLSASARPSDSLNKGGFMHRFLIALLVCAGLFALANVSEAQQLKIVTGYLTPGNTVTFHSRVPNNSALDTIYEISGDYNISGTLVVQEGAEVQFLPNSRIIDSTCGKIIANGYTGSQRRILFRGEPVNANSYEWGHFLVLPGADSVFFANVRFVNFRKRTSVDVTPIFDPSIVGDAAYSASINLAANGNGGVMTTFSHKTFLYNVIVDSCQTSFRGGAFAFLQAPTNALGSDCDDVPNVNDDGRIALANSQVRWLVIRDTRCFNNETGTYTDANADGGAIYMASNNENLAPGNYVLGYLGNRPGPFFADSSDVMVFERCTANNTFTTAGSFAKGGAVYVGSNTGLVVSQGTFNSNSAINATDANAWGGAIAVSPTSVNPAQVPPGVGIIPGTDRLPGLAVLKTATFAGNSAGIGGAIYMGFSLAYTRMPLLDVDGENINPLTGVRDSGLIAFNHNIAYIKGGAIYSASRTFITGYLAPQGFAFGGGSQSVELRVRFFNNKAGEAGGSICEDGLSQSGQADLVERRTLQLQNVVDPNDADIVRPQYTTFVLGGGAEFVGNRDSAFAVEFNGNTVQGGSGGGVYVFNPTVSGSFPVIMYYVEDGYNAQNVATSPFPFDQRQLTRFIGNHAYLGTDSTALYNYNPTSPHGRGGGLAINVSNQNIAGIDTTYLSRVRFEENEAYSGSAIYSDNFNLKVLSNLCLIANNLATSPSSARVDLDASGLSNPADSNVGATIWGDFEGPLPSYESNSRGDAIYDNVARYILRLPMARGTGALGVGGTDTIRGNFWGETGPSVITQINNPNLPPNTGALQSTFFIDYYKSCFLNVYEPNRNPPTGYTPVQVGIIPDTDLMEGRVYDLFDKGTDMRVADYGNRRLAPAEAFSLGLPNDVATIHRFTRNIFDTNSVYVQKIDLYQTDFVGPHPIGYPLFLQANVSLADSNRDDYAKNYTVLMVFDQTTNEFVRVNAKETVVNENGATLPQQLYQGRLDFVPDSSVTERHASSRQRTLYTLSLLRPQTMTFDEVQRASKLEDSAALDGREYTLLPSDLMSSAPGDTICTENNGGFTSKTTWYAGERYHTLPVRPGDHMLVISRTLLWKNGAAYAIAHGLQFVIGDIEAPAFTGDVPSLQSDPYNPNRRFVKEDVNYDNSSPAQTLFRIGGYDPNNFYDPRFLFDQGRFTQLAFNLSIDNIPGDANPEHVRLNHWLHDTIIYNANVIGSNGYVQLYGQPHNPDVVPGGEGVTVTVTNFPPNFNSEFGLNQAFDSSVLGPDAQNLSLWTFPPYMNCPEKTAPFANGVQQEFLPDTLCVRPTSTTYHFKIIVEDSLPVFTSGTTVPCANLTDSLRFHWDIQTDDESEDSVAEAEMVGGVHAWDFRYGKTSYRFLAVPSWMQQVASDPLFISKGIINVTLDAATAMRLVTPTPQVNGELNLDTVVSVEVNDGHTGKAVQTFRVHVGIPPTITTASLRDAREGTDYSQNFQNPDSVSRIGFYNPYGQTATFQLLYEGQIDTVYTDGENQIGQTILVGTTPAWLHIDPFSGVLTGTPGINDAPRTASTSCGGPDTVTVVVNGECNLMAWSQLPLSVDSIQHLPFFVRGQKALCITNNTAFCDSSIRVSDLDLLRLTCLENLKLQLLSPNDSGAHLTVTPATVPGPLGNDTAIVTICGTLNKPLDYFNSSNPIPDMIVLLVTDVAGNTDTLSYAIRVGDVPTFECAIDVSNAVTSLHPLEDIQHLCFGAGRFGTDALDPIYCEAEIPPPPNAAVFQSHWVLPIGGQIEGTYIDVRRDTNQYNNITWQVNFNSGGEAGGALNIPVEICWTKSCLDPTGKMAGSTFATGDFYLRQAQNSNEFSINMRTGQGPIDNSLYDLVQKGSDTMCLVIHDQSLTNALIVFVPARSGVETTPTAQQFALEPNFPNPVMTTTTLNFTVAERSNVRIDIYDVKGSLVRTLVNEDLDPGTYPVTWDATDASGNALANGTYIARMTAGSFTSSVKMSLTKSSN